MGQDHRTKLAVARHGQTLELIRTLTVHPTAANVPMRIMELYRAKEMANFDAFAEVIVTDAALAAKVLELANSAFFSRSRCVTKVSDGLRMIGLNNVFPLLFGLSLAGIYNKAGLPPEERTSLWQASLLKGIVARQWAKWSKIDLAEEAFLCGVLQDVALPAMFAADRSASPELAGVIDLHDERRVERESAMFDADHCAFGKLLCETLHLPELYINATATHHNPEGPELPERFAELRPGLHLASELPHGMAKLDEHSIRHLAERFIVAVPQAGEAGAAEFIQQVSESIKTFSVMLFVATAAGGMKAFLQEVADQIAKTVFTSIGNSNLEIERLHVAQNELESRIRELDEEVVKSEYDPLTNVLNRRGLVNRAPKLLSLARKLQMGCAVGFVDLDGFKEVNDIHGHQSGDQALVTAAGALRNMLQNRGMIARCGGDEFVFVLVVPINQRDKIAEQARRAIQATKFTSTTGQPLRVGASVGVAWLGVPEENQDIEDAVKLADELMYRQKRSAKLTLAN